MAFCALALGITPVLAADASAGAGSWAARRPRAGPAPDACLCSRASDADALPLALGSSATSALTGLDASFAGAVVAPAPAPATTPDPGSSPSPTQPPSPDPPPAPAPEPAPSPGTVPGPALGAERSPFDDLDDDPVLGSIPPASFASPLTTDKPYWRSNIFKRILTDQAFLVTKWWPSEIQHWSFTGPLIGATLFAAGSTNEGGYDLKVSQHASGGTSGQTKSVAVFFTRAGNGAPASAALGIAYLLARHTGNDRLAEASSISFEALISTGLWVTLIKDAAARHRPTQDSNGKFFQYGQKDSSSFPSGHSMGAFTIATVFAHVYSDKKWMPWVAYGSAAAIAWSRVALGRHFPSDVIAGAILGNSVARMALTRDGRDGPLSPIHFQPIYDPKNKGFGVGYTYRW